MSRKICVFTGTRAEYGLLYWLMKDIIAAQDLTLQLIVSGSHLSSHHGHTIEKIESDGFHINCAVDLELTEHDTRSDIASAAGRATAGVADALKKLKPDVILLLGDRYELLGAATAALLCGVPIFHLHGGELTEGAYDDAIRHSVTKMASWHGVANEVYRKRVIQMGEEPEKVFNVGGLGLDNFTRLDLLSKDELQDQLDFHFGKKTALVTYHSVTNSTDEDVGFENLLKVLEERTDISIIFTYPNADQGRAELVKKMERFISRFPERSRGWRSLGQLRYLSTLKYADGVIGNSSSGIIEAPSFGIGTVNIGERQSGRLKAFSVVDCDSDYASISAAVEKVFDTDFVNGMGQLSNPYGTGGAAQKLVNILQTLILPDQLGKPFFDIPFDLS
ncbi:MAG: UDP-N-acetylglucosamine 2-epimerase (hydrolyzing) [Gammaproteobacteria bacterium]|nr:UDP-N-acetylglucosamine 2-epimerase (hydrolyzing) [Gammaproteobacteria bacterium]